MSDNRISITLPSDSRWLDFAYDSLHRYGQMVGFSSKLIEMLAHSAIEACEQVYRLADRAGVSDSVSLLLDFKGQAVVIDIEYNRHIPLNPHKIDDYEVPDKDTDIDDLDMDALWLYLIKQRMDRIRFMVKGSRRALRMIKYRRDEGREKQAWVMAVRPVLRKGLHLHLDDPKAQYPSSVLQYKGKGTLKLGPSETFIVRNMDEKATFHELYMLHIDAMGLISPDTLALLYEKLEHMGMLADPEACGKNNLLRQVAKHIINPDFSIPRADDVVTTVHDRATFFFTCPGMIILLAIGISGIIPFWEHFTRFREVIAGLEERGIREPLLVLPLYLLVILQVILHELGHGVTCKHYGGRVHHLGIMFYLASFIFYCDTTAAWNFPKKRHRILVSLGGPIISFATFGAGLWAAGYYAGTGLIWEDVFVAFSLITLLGLAMNVNPFIKMDAYYMLLDYTGIHNLRHRSFKFLEHKIFGWLDLGTDSEINATQAERRIFWWYGTFGVVVTVVFLVIPVLRLYHLLNTESISSGRLVFIVLIVCLLIMRIGTVAFRKIKAVRYREYKIQ